MGVRVESMRAAWAGGGACVGALAVLSRSTLTERASPEWGYATDVEGDLHFWNKYVELSRVLNRDTNGTIHLKDGAHFIFGGDAVDQGTGDHQFLVEIMSLHR